MLQTKYSRLRFMYRIAMVLYMGAYGRLDVVLRTFNIVVHMTVFFVAALIFYWLLDWGIDNLGEPK